MVTLDGVEHPDAALPWISTQPLSPFGLEVTVPVDTPWSALSEDQVHAWVAEHRVVVFRGLAPLGKRDLPLAARRLGPLQAWSLGAINELKPEDDAKNYLYTRRQVPLHWDGAFAGKVPRYLFFQCLDAPLADAGGETTFVDTKRVWANADVKTRDVWRSLRFTYETSKVAHYGGRFTSPVVSQHPNTHETVLRFAEPVDDLNPVSVRAEGVSPLESAALLTQLRTALYQPDVVMHHRWRPGDVVVADNHALLHGRRAFEGESRRHLQRVNVHDKERTFRDDLQAALLIRRPEFMIAELPILLIPALLLSPSWSALWSVNAGVMFLLFFLLFHFGDIINCLADRELDAVYKTHLSEAVYGLGVNNVKWQLGITTLLCLVLTAYLTIATQRIELVFLVLTGLVWAGQYSVGPLHLKGRGVLQVVTLWGVIFVIPMLIVSTVFSSQLTPVMLLLIAAYGAMQEGIILVNTAEDLPEDNAMGIHTTAVALGLTGSLKLAVGLVGVGGAVTLACLAWLMVPVTGNIPLALLPLAGGWWWVLWQVRGTLRAVQQAAPGKDIKALRPRAKMMPIWITVTAWATLLAAAFARP